MNIVHFEDEPWDSGLAHYALTLAAEQARRGARVAVWGLRDSLVLKQAAGLGLETRGWSKGPRGWAEIPSLRRQLADFAPRIVNAHTGSSHTRALLLAPKGAAVVRTRGDARPARGTFLSRAAAKRTAAFIAANAEIQGKLKQEFPGARVRFVPQGIEGPASAPPLPRAPILGMIARLDLVKGHEILLAAARSLAPKIPGLAVLCAGEGRLWERLRGADPSGTVQFLGRVPDQWDFMNDCRVGVVASIRSEAVSRAALEWMAAGRPLIATRVGGIPDLVEHGVTGLLVRPNDAQALADAAAWLLADPARAEALGAAARARWKERFSPEPFDRATQEVYDEAVDSVSR